MPDSVMNRIDTTRARDRRQSGGWDEVAASWDYNPDKALNLVIEPRFDSSPQFACSADQRSGTPPY